MSFPSKTNNSHVCLPVRSNENALAFSVRSMISDRQRTSPSAMIKNSADPLSGKIPSSIPARPSIVIALPSRASVNLLPACVPTPRSYTFPAIRNGLPITDRLILGLPKSCLIALRSREDSSMVSI